MATGKKINFRIPKKPPQPEESSSDVSKTTSVLSIKEKLERAKKLAASLGSSKSTSTTTKDKHSVKNHKAGHSSSKNHKVDHSSSKNHKVDQSSSSKHKVDQSSSNKHKDDQSSTNKHRHETNSSSNHKKSDNDIHSTNKDVQKQTTNKKPSYIEKLEKLSDEQKMEIIKKISGSLGRKGDKISDEEKLDKIRKISETIGKGSSKCDKKEKVNNSQKQTPLTGKVDREKLSGSIESLQQMKKDLKETEEKVSGNVITMLGKTDDGIKREVKHFDRSDAEKMRQALQDKAARIKAMMNRSEEPKPKERKRKKEISAEFVTEKSEDSPSEEKKKSSSDVRKSSSHSTENKSREKYSSEKNTETNSREEKTIKKKKMPPPPSMNFNDLLKIAEKKSQEPIKIEVKKPVKEEERLLTKKELKSQKEYQEFLEYKARQRKEAQREERESVEVKKEKVNASSSLKSKSASNLPSRPSNSSQSTLKKNPYSDKSLTSKSSSNLFSKPTNSHLTSKSGHKSSSPVPSSSKMGQKSVSTSSSAHAKPFTKNFKMQSSNNSDKKQNSNFSQAKKMKLEHSASERSSSKKDDIRKKSSGAKPSNYDNVGENVLVCGPPKSEKNTKPVASNPFDRICGEIKKNQPSRPAKRKYPGEYSDSDDELDQDIDGFVVDYLSSEEEEEMDEDYEDYSKHIRDIFGYDKRKFKYESDYDIANMEANFREVMKEEARSARLGLQEDLEDIRKEEEEMKRKAAAKKKRK